MRNNRTIVMLRCNVPQLKALIAAIDHSEEAHVWTPKEDISRKYLHRSLRLKLRDLMERR